jgi:hypothetical protein
MIVTGSFKSNLCCIYSKKTFSLLFIVALVFSSFLLVTNRASAVPDVVVGTEDELLNAISAAPNKKQYTIDISDDLVLKNSLEIPKNKRITLVVFGRDSSFALIGCDGVDTVIVRSGGELVLLSGVVITHAKGDSGRGVYVENKGKFILTGGEISGNTVNDAVGGGVYNQGVFKMLTGGKISGNNALNGGGVYNAGNFEMVDGVISDNAASSDGGGVYNSADGSFVMSGGEITCNTARYGGGVHYFSGTVKGTVTLSGGKIFNNTATGGFGYSPDLDILFVDGWYPAMLFVLLLIVSVAVVVVVCVLLFYRTKRRKKALFL